MDAVEKMLEHFSRLSPAVNRNAQVVSPQLYGQDYVLHISKNNNIKEFVPIIGHRQAKSEDRTLPRICTAGTILGCMIAYASVENDFFVMGSQERKEKVWHGGYKIYGFKFEAAILPNKNLVYDQTKTGETWLISYDQDYTKWFPEDYGRIFVRVMSYTADGKSKPDGDMVLYVDVRKEDGLAFSDKVILEKGYYKITGPSPLSNVTWRSGNKYEIVKIDRSEYFANKSAVADTLGFSENVPDFMRW